MNAHRAAFIVMVAALLVAPAVVYPVFLMKVMCFALFASAFNLLIGYGGLLSFGHAMFLGTAGYASAHRETFRDESTQIDLDRVVERKDPLGRIDAIEVAARANHGRARRPDDVRLQFFAVRRRRARVLCGRRRSHPEPHADETGDSPRHTRLDCGRAAPIPARAPPATE